MSGPERKPIDEWVRVPGRLAAALTACGFVPGRGAVFAAAEVDDEWAAVLGELTAAFELTRSALQHETPVVYVVAHDDLLGRRGPGAAMVAAGLLSGARTAAAETRKAGIPVNTLAVEGDWDPQAVATWVLRLLEPGGPTGELVRLGGDHIGRVLP